MGAQLIHAKRRTDGRTDMTMLIVGYRNFANAPKKRYSPYRAVNTTRLGYENQ